MILNSTFLCYYSSMKKWMKENVSFVVRASLLVFFIAVIVVLGVLKNDVEFCEAYSRTFGRYLTVGIASITKYFPISFTECMAICAAIAVVISIVLIVKFLKKKEFFYALKRVVNIGVLISSVVMMLSATTQLQYNRKAVPIPLYEEKVEKTEFMTIIKHFEDDYNDCARSVEYKPNGEPISPYSLMEMNLILEKEFKRLDDPKFGRYFTSFTTNCKPMMSSEIYSHLQVTGITIGCFGEANVNTAAPTAGIPFVMAHELAHIKGVMREDDANLVALYLTLTSEDKFIRSSGYFYSFNRLMSLASLTGVEGDYQTVSKALDPLIYGTYRQNNDYWDAHDIINDIGEWFNDLYLKSSGTEGTSSYEDTKTEVEGDKIISFSTYQKLYFHIYYEM